MRINGVDVDPDTSGRDDYRLSCRIKHQTGGLVPYRMIGLWQPYGANTSPSGCFWFLIFLLITVLIIGIVIFLGTMGVLGALGTLLVG